MSLQKNILNTIKKNHIVPISRSRILRRKYLFFGLFWLLIGLGIFIVSFFISDASEVVEFLEIDTLYILLIWIIVIIWFAILIYRDSRNIGTLYRYSMGQVIAIIFITMILWWALIQLSGVGRYIQWYLIKYTGYENLMSTYKYWDNPTEWRLIGEIIEISTKSLIIEDREDALWNIVLISDTDYGGGIEIGKTIKISWALEWSGIFTASEISVLFE